MDDSFEVHEWCLFNSDILLSFFEGTLFDFSLKHSERLICHGKYYYMMWSTVTVHIRPGRNYGLTNISLERSQASRSHMVLPNKGPILYEGYHKIKHFACERDCFVCLGEVW